MIQAEAADKRQAAAKRKIQQQALLKKEALAIAEANKLGIPVVAVVDTNCSPAVVDYIIPGNDDASRAISLYCDLAARAALDGMTAQMGAAGVDLGALEEAPVEEAVAQEAEAQA